MTDPRRPMVEQLVRAFNNGTPPTAHQIVMGAGVIPGWWVGYTKWDRIGRKVTRSFAVRVPEDRNDKVSWAHGPASFVITDTEELIDFMRNEWLPEAEQWLRDNGGWR